MINKTQQQQTLIDQTDQKMKMTHQKKERNQNVGLEKKVAAETEDWWHPTDPDALEAEQTPHLLLSYKSSEKLQTNSPTTKGWKLE